MFTKDRAEAEDMSTKNLFAEQKSEIKNGRVPVMTLLAGAVAPTEAVLAAERVIS